MSSSLTSLEYHEDAQKTAVLIYKLKWLVIFRIALVTILLGSALVIQLKVNKTRPLELLYFFIVLSYIFTAVSLHFLRKVKHISRYAYIQILYDLCLETGIIYITGGVESVFTFTYIFTIIAASILLFRRGGFFAASLSTIFYGILINLQLYRVLPLYGLPPLPFTIVNSSTVYYNIFLNSCAFYLVAFLSSYLSESLRRTHQRLRETTHDLTELQTFHHNILQSINSGLLTTDLHGKITLYNQAAESITGFQLSEVYGRPLQYIFPDIDTTQLLKTLPSAYKAVHRFETTIVPRENIKIYLGISVSLLLDNTTRVSGLIFIFQDLTELKEMEERIARADRLAAIGQLAAGVAHEIRNPLAAISGSIQMLKADLDMDADNKALMEIILRESARLDTIITDFLIYARPKKLSFAKCDIIHEVVVPTIGLLKRDPRFATESIDIHIDSAPNFPKIVCDVQLLQQAFWNLLLNAFQAMQAEGTLTISTRIEKYAGDALGGQERSQSSPPASMYVGIISIRDTGPGMNEEQLQHLFHPFYTTKKEGTGLGLAITYSIIEKHHGTIKVHSAADDGTTFEVLLPLRQDQW